MDPVSMGLMASGLSAAATGVGAIGSAASMRAQGEADRTRAGIERQWDERRALEETAAGQRTGAADLRQMKLAQGALTARAGASGSSASDPTVMNLWKGIEGQGELNAANDTTAAAQRAAGLRYQGDLGLWSADANSRIRDAGANMTLLGGGLGAAGQFGRGYSDMVMPRMAQRYSDFGAPGSTYTYGSGPGGRYG